MEILQALLCRRFRQTGPHDFEYDTSFREIVVRALPKHHADIALLAKVGREPTEGSEPIKVMVVNRRGERVSDTDMFVPLDDPAVAARPVWSLAFQLRNVTLVEAGSYRVRLSVGDEVLWEEPFEVTLRTSWLGRLAGR